jgi:hypothetical protein
MQLRHARMDPLTGQLAIQELAGGTDTTVALLDQRYVVYTVNQGDPAGHGLYVHGPLP